MVTARQRWYDDFDDLKPLVPVGRRLADVLKLQGDSERMEPATVLDALGKQLGIVYDAAAVESVLVHLALELERDLRGDLIEIVDDEGRRDEIALNAFKNMELIDELLDVIMAMGSGNQEVNTTVAALRDELQRIAETSLKAKLHQTTKRWRREQVWKVGRHNRIKGLRDDPRL